MGENAGVLRLVRLLRLCRIVRVLRSPVFEDLVEMVQGMMGSFVTLAWSAMLFLFCIYVVSLVFRGGLGPVNVKQTELDNSDVVEEYFKNVPRSMLTVFRCSFGDCSTDGGTPIFEHVVEAHGWAWSFVYAIFLFIVVVGLFNVISSIFVQAALTYSARIAAEEKQARLKDETLWATNFVALLQLLLEPTGLFPQFQFAMMNCNTTSSNILEQILHVQIPRHVFQTVVEENVLATETLTRLDVNIADSRHLADILDPDNNGTVGVLELLHGLMRLRGNPCRSDIVAIDLMVRSLQEKIDDVWRWVRDGKDSVTEDGNRMPSSWATAVDGQVEAAWNGER